MKIKLRAGYIVVDENLVVVIPSPGSKVKKGDTVVITNEVVRGDFTIGNRKYYVIKESDVGLCYG